MKRISLFAVVAVALVVAAPAAAKSKSCGSYSKNDGSLADGVVTKISVVGLSCAGGQKVAGRYTGAVGKFKAAGFSCLAYQAGNPPQQAGTVKCTKRREVVRYRNAPMTDCSTAPGIIVPPGTGTAISGPWTYGTDCPTAVTVVNAADAATTNPPLPPGWTCNDNTSTVATGGWCSMPTGTTYDVVQWNDNVEPPGY
jgi:hypothetical protein